MPPTGPRFVTYYRVSTSRQGRSGLGLDAQREAVRAYLAGHRGREVATFTEVESGKRADRPQLAAALARCRQTRATLLVAKLDRLSRAAGFLFALRDAGTPFLAADMPDMNETVVGIMAVLAQDEARRISERTRLALAAAKARGKRLGNPRLKPGSAVSAAVANAANVARAKARAEDLRDVIASAQEGGCKTLRSLADRLNELAIPTPRGCIWNATAVSRLLARLEAPHSPGN